MRHLRDIIRSLSAEEWRSEATASQNQVWGDGGFDSGFSNSPRRGSC